MTAGATAAGTTAGVITINSNGVVTSNNTPDTATYTINANCTGTWVSDIAGGSHARARPSIPHS